MTGLESHEVPEEVDPEGWTLRVTGAVDSPLDLDRADVAALPAETFEEDFECVEGWTAADLTWRGVRVGALIDRADPTSAASHALVRAMDGEYACSFPIERLATAVLATELDGEALPVEHGGPARLVPTESGTDCWEQIKWVAEIELRESEPSDGDTAKELALSRIDS
ncbi:molybdopterin-dependent oxidoreductase [Halobellus sp. EA9]|uniref:molybdopterin-dependent oxidoreductase n=1 Tax=Halobellus sp. EA9 TaxID=3421647 RepID=UPI003EBDF2D3